MNVFPSVMSLPDILIGSSQRIVFDREAVAARLSDPRVQDHYEVAGIDIEVLLGMYLLPRDEFDLSPIFDRINRAAAR